MASLSKVIENSIVFTLSKQGRFSKFKNNEDGRSNPNKRDRKLVIGLPPADFQREYGHNDSAVNQTSVFPSEEEEAAYKVENESLVTDRAGEE